MQLLSFSCHQIPDGYSQGGKKDEESVQHSHWFVFLWEKGGCQSLIHVTLHLQMAASSTCSETTKPFASRGLDQVCPSMWTESARHVHYLLRCSRSFHALKTNPRETTAVLTLTQLAHQLYQQLTCFTNYQGKLQVQGCSIDSGVKSMELVSLSHILSTFIDILFWSLILSPNN